MSDELLELMQRKEPLDPELRPWIIKNGPLGRMLKHPLIFSLIYDEKICAMLNASFRYKKEYIEKCREQKQWSHYCFMYERPYRWNAFQEIADEVTSDEEYWKLFGSLWTDAEFIWQSLPQIVKLLMGRSRDKRHFMMDEGERELFGLFADDLTLYRGCDRRNRRGFSWTLDKEKAIWFAKRFRDKGGLCLVGQARKSDVIAFFSSRNEKEIVIHPAHVKVVQTLRL